MSVHGASGQVLQSPVRNLSIVPVYGRLAGFDPAVGAGVAPPIRRPARATVPAAGRLEVAVRDAPTQAVSGCQGGVGSAPRGDVGLQYGRVGRTFVSSLRDANADLPDVQRLVGHASTATTLRYHLRMGMTAQCGGALRPVPVRARSK